MKDQLHLQKACDEHTRTHTQNECKRTYKSLQLFVFICRSFLLWISPIYTLYTIMAPTLAATTFLMTPSLFLLKYFLSSSSSLYSECGPKNSSIWSTWGGEKRFCYCLVRAKVLMFYHTRGGVSQNHRDCRFFLSQERWAHLALQVFLLHHMQQFIIAAVEKCCKISFSGVLFSIDCLHLVTKEQNYAGLLND